MQNQTNKPNDKVRNTLVFATLLLTFIHAFSNCIKDLLDYLAKR